MLKFGFAWNESSYGNRKKNAKKSKRSYVNWFAKDKWPLLEATLKSKIYNLALIDA
jgi:hypothetical protein